MTKIRNFAGKFLLALTRLGRHQLLMLIMLALMVVLFFLFLEIAEEVSRKETQALDELILMILREKTDLSDPIGPEWFEELARDITALGGLGVLAIFTFMAVGYLAIEKKNNTAILLLISVFGGAFLIYLLKLGFNRPRPSLVPHEVYIYYTSFPSGHAMLSAIAYFTIAALLAQVHEGFRVKIYILSVAGFLVLLIGLSRIYLGVHWPTDILAGWSAGALWALLVLLLDRWMRKIKSI